MGFVGLTIVIPAFWNVMPCSVIMKCQCFRGMFRPVQRNIPETIIFLCSTVRTSGNKHVYCDIRIG